MRLSRAVIATLALPICVSCAQQVCEKEFACQEELGIDYDDDYVDVCVATREGQDKVLRANAEPECRALADATSQLAACEAVLSCEDLAASRAAAGADADTDADKCKDLRKIYTDALADADLGLACDGIDEPDVTPAE